MKNRIIAALDTPSLDEAMTLCESLQGEVGLVKIGLELFVSKGQLSVYGAQRRGMDVFLDLKLHDIPNTVEGAARDVAKMGVQMLTVHASGGPTMIAAAKKGLGTSGTKLLAVTVLTSLSQDDLWEMEMLGSITERVLGLGKMALKAGADGLVCSPRELLALRAAIGPTPLLVVPGIRPAGSDKGDQVRTATPFTAIQAGASYLVVGRPLREGGDPKKAARQIADEMAVT